LGGEDTSLGGCPKKSHLERERGLQNQEEEKKIGKIAKTTWPLSAKKKKNKGDAHRPE